MKKQIICFDHISSPELKSTAIKAYDLAVQAQRHRSYRCTTFLNPAELKIALDVANFLSDVHPAILERTKDDERKIVCFCSGDTLPPSLEMEAALLHLTWNSKFGTLEHGDFLGAILSLGLKREVLGDIRFQENHAYIFVLETVKDYIQYNLTQVGSFSIKVDIMDNHQFLPPKEQGKVREVIVSSLRLDGFLAATLRVSRNIAQKWIREGIVQLSYRSCGNPSATIQAGDLISVRGKGRILFDEVSGKTGKDRFRIRCQIWQR